MPPSGPVRDVQSTTVRYQHPMYQHLLRCATTLPFLQISSVRPSLHPTLLSATCAHLAPLTNPTLSPGCSSPELGSTSPDELPTALHFLETIGHKPPYWIVQASRMISLNATLRSSLCMQPYQHRCVARPSSVRCTCGLPQRKRTRVRDITSLCHAHSHA